MSMQSSFVRNILLTLSYRNRPERLDLEVSEISVLLAYSPVGMEEGFRCMETLRKENVRYRLWVDESLADCYSTSELAQRTGNDLIAWKERDFRSTSSSHILLPVLSYSLVSRLIHLDDRDPFSRFILEALFKGKKVAGISIGADPYHPEWKAKGLDQAKPLLKHDMKLRLQQLRGYGIELLAPQQISEWLKRGKGSHEKKRLLSEGDIREAYANGKLAIPIGPHTLITPLAKDLARQYGIELHGG